jgi:hypothetical protein
MEQSVHDAIAAGGGKELIPKTEQTACGDEVCQPNSVFLGVYHIQHLSTPNTQHFHNHTGGFLIGFDLS